MNQTACPLKVFISYSHKDESWRQKLDAHLSLLRQQEILEVWHDRKILGSEDWNHAIDDKLTQADIVLLLVSANFIDSKYCFGLEMKTAMVRAEEGTVRVVPIIMCECDWKSAAFARYQALPRDNKAVETHPRGVNAALTEVAEGLRELALAIINRGSASTSAKSERAEIFHPGNWWQRNRRARLVGVGVLLAVGLVTGLSALQQSLQATQNGNRDLRLGAYERAKREFDTAASWNPFSTEARRGVRLSKLGLMLTDMEHQAADFSRELEALESERPNDPVIRLFVGDRAFEAYRRGDGAQDLSTAEAAYREAAQSGAVFPEAHARLGFLLDLKGELVSAEQAWREAVGQASTDTALAAKYRNGLAGVLAQLGRTKDALRLYDGDPEYARSSIDAAMLRWQGPPTADSLEQAHDRLERLRTHLTGTGAADAWGFKAGSELVLLGRIEAQRCLAVLALAATEYLQGQEQSAQAELNKFGGNNCEGGRADIMLVACDRLEQAAATINTRALAARAWLRCPASKPPHEKLPTESPRLGSAERMSQT